MEGRKRNIRQRSTTLGKVVDVSSSHVKVKNFYYVAGCINAEGELLCTTRGYIHRHRVCDEIEELNMRNKMLIGTIVAGGFLTLGVAGAGAAPEQVAPYGTAAPTTTVVPTTVAGVAVAPTTTVKIIGDISPQVAGVAVAADPGLAASRLPVTGGDISALGVLALAGLGVVGIRASRRRTVQN